MNYLHNLRDVVPEWSKGGGSRIVFFHKVLWIRLVSASPVRIRSTSCGQFLSGVKYFLCANSMNALTLNFEKVLKGKRSYDGFARNMMQKHGLTQKQYQNMAPAAARRAKARVAKSKTRVANKKPSLVTSMKTALIGALLASKGAMAPIVSDLYNTPALRRKVHLRPVSLYQGNNNYKNLRLLRQGMLGTPSLCRKHPCRPTKQRYLQELNAEIAASFANGTLHTNKNAFHTNKNAKPLRLFAPYMRYHAPTMYRGVMLPKSLLKDIVQQGSWDTNHYSSFSAKESIAKMFALGWGRNTISILMRVSMNNITPGTPLLWTAEGSHESEILFPPGKFTVKRIKQVRSWLTGQKRVHLDASFDPNKKAHAVGYPNLLIVSNSHPKPANLPKRATVASNNAHTFRSARTR